MRGEGSLAAVALRERALGPGLAVRRSKLEPGSRATAVLDAVADWLDGAEPEGVAVHVGRLPDEPGRIENGTLAPRGGGWPFMNVSMAEGLAPGDPGPAVAVAALTDGNGGIAEVRVVVDAGRICDPVMAEGHARGGAHMGLGAALSERVVREAGVTKSVTIRSLGIVPAAATPPIHVRFVGDGPPRAGIAEACVAPAGAAIMLAAGGRSLPDLDTPAARRLRRQR
jgi:CO/xanthine dehydrogenase Mo-binding subunit